MSSFSLTKLSGYNVLTLTGRMDAKNSLLLKIELRELLNQGKHKLVIDLKEVEFIDSAFLGVLVSSLRLAEEMNGSIALVEGNERVMRIIKQTRLDKVFKIYASMEQACR